MSDGGRRLSAQPLRQAGREQGDYSSNFATVNLTKVGTKIP
jgi:hypothetical protein